MSDVARRAPSVVRRAVATTVGALVEEVAGVLREADIEYPTREAREIVAAVFDVPRFWPTLNAGAAVPQGVGDRALRAAVRRTHGAPFQYAVGSAAFRGLTLAVDERVLIPRPETELLVDIVLDELGDEPGGVVVDVGTGSGAIALALAVEGRFDRVIGVDISRDALAVAEANRESLPSAGPTVVDLRHGSLLAPVDAGPLRAVVSNPPYIATGEAAELPRSVRDWEPAVALFSGPSGLEATAALVAQSATRLAPGGLLALEVDMRRASLVMELVSRDDRYAEVGVRLDLTGRERFVLARRRET
jgi:release factor glutamine methyltransferase